MYEASRIRLRMDFYVGQQYKIILGGQHGRTPLLRGGASIAQLIVRQPLCRLGHPVDKTSDSQGVHTSRKFTRLLLCQVDAYVAGS